MKVCIYSYFCLGIQHAHICFLLITCQCIFCKEVLLVLALVNCAQIVCSRPMFWRRQKYVNPMVLPQISTLFIPGIQDRIIQFHCSSTISLKSFQGEESHVIQWMQIELPFPYMFCIPIILLFV